MSKAILILNEMPKSCEECKFNTSYYAFDDICSADKTWCPLKSMPQKILDIFEAPQDYREGWNDCIDEILGGEE